MPTNPRKCKRMTLICALTTALRLKQFADAAILADELDRRMHLVFYAEYVAYRASIAD